MSDQTIGLITGLLHVALAVLLGVVTTYGSFRILGRLMRTDDHIEQLKSNNTAMAILLGGLLIANALIVKVATEPAISTAQVFLFRSPSWSAFLKTIGLIGGYALLAILLANLSVWVSMNLFLWLTRDLDELAEIRANNVAVAVTVGVTVAVMGMFLSDGLASLMQALVPFPAYHPLEVLGG